METDFESLERSRGIVARERVVRDLQTLMRDAEGLMKVTAGDLGERAQEARVRLGRAVESAKATCNALRERMVTATKAATRQGDTIIRGNIYAAIGITFSLGLLIGVLVRRRRVIYG